MRYTSSMYNGAMARASVEKLLFASRLAAGAHVPGAVTRPGGTASNSFRKSCTPWRKSSSSLDDLVLTVLSLIDLVLVGSLIVMVMLSG